MPAVLGYGAALATILGVFNYTGGRLTGPYERGYVDEVERKEYIRKNRRRPVEETVHQLGEGRGKWHTKLPFRGHISWNLEFLEANMRS